MFDSDIDPAPFEPPFQDKTSEQPPRQDARKWADDVEQTFFPFALIPCSSDDFHAGGIFKRGPGMGVASVTADRHVATVSQSNRAAAESGMTKMLWMLDGAAEFEQGDWTWQVSPGEWVAYDIDKPYRFLSLSRTSFITVICHKQLLGLPTGIFSKPEARRVEDLSLMTLQFARSALRQDVTLSQRAVSALAYGIQQCIMGGMTPQELTTPVLASHAQLVADAKRYIASHLQDYELRADSIAEALGVSRRTLYAAFATLSETPARSIQEARLLHAQQALAAHAPDSQNITKLAMNVGFNDAAHFSRSYRKMFGEPPSTTRDRFSAIR